MKFRTKPVVVEAITFEELVEHGIASGGNVVDGMPWSFAYQGQPITHENNDCYLVTVLGVTTRFNRGDMLVTRANGSMYPCPRDIFAMTFEPAE